MLMMILICPNLIWSYSQSKNHNDNSYEKHGLNVQI